jgi:hypothetical protein
MKIRDRHLFLWQITCGFKNIHALQPRPYLKAERGDITLDEDSEIFEAGESLRGSRLWGENRE